MSSAPRPGSTPTATICIATVFRTRAFSVPIEPERRLYFLVLTRFLQREPVSTSLENALVLSDVAGLAAGPARSRMTQSRCRYAQWRTLRRHSRDDRMSLNRESGARAIEPREWPRVVDEK